MPGQNMAEIFYTHPALQSRGEQIAQLGKQTQYQTEQNRIS